MDIAAEVRRDIYRLGTALGLLLLLCGAAGYQIGRVIARRRPCP